MYEQAKRNADRIVSPGVLHEVGVEDLSRRGKEERSQRRASIDIRRVPLVELDPEVTRRAGCRGHEPG